MKALPRIILAAVTAGKIVWAELTSPTVIKR